MSAVFANSTRNSPPDRGSRRASLPFQRTYSTGSVRRRNTVSGDSSMVIVRSMTFVSTAMPCPPLLFLLRGVLQRAQAFIPEVLEIRAHLRERLRSRAVEALRPVPALAHEPRLPQDAKVLRDRGSCDLEAPRDLSHGELASRDEPKDLATSRLPEGGEGIHLRN